MQLPSQIKHALQMRASVFKEQFCPFFNSSKFEFRPHWMPGTTNPDPPQSKIVIRKSYFTLRFSSAQ